MADKAIRQVRASVERILVRNGWEGARATAVAEALTEGRWTHDYPITVEQAQELGLPVGVDMPEDIYRFMSLFPQPRAQRPSVEYVPVPYGPRERAEQPRRAAPGR